MASIFENSKRIAAAATFVAVALLCLGWWYYVAQVRPQASVVSQLEEKQARFMYDHWIVWHSDDWMGTSYDPDAERRRTPLTDFFHEPQVITWRKADISDAELRLLQKLPSIRLFEFPSAMPKHERNRVKAALPGVATRDRFELPPFDLPMPFPMGEPEPENML